MSITNDGSVKILDFDLAELTQGNSIKSNSPPDVLILILV
jgi:hypothetical protein